MQEKTCPRCGLAVGDRQPACHFCGASLVSGQSRRLVLIALTTMAVLSIALFAAQWFTVHRSSQPAAPETGAVRP